jgi:dipeptidyl aminopeptidase/acylaminoacyl peptidase
MPADDPGKARQITFGTIGSNDGVLGLDWTPGNQLVYASATGRGHSIWTIDPDGTNAKQITAPEYEDAMPNITADGRTMVFESNRSGGAEIWRANPDGSEPGQLTTCGQNFQPNVSPDGKWVVYKSNCDGIGSLWRVPLTGGPPQRLTQKAFSWPSVSPDGKWIACGFATAVKYQTVIIPFDGGEPARIFDTAPLANIRLGIRWTSDGKSVVYRDQRVGLWRQTVAGGLPNVFQVCRRRRSTASAGPATTSFSRIRWAPKYATWCC